MYHSRLQQRLLVFNYTVWAVCKYVSVCMRFTVHHIALPPTSISGLVCVSLGASWVTDVCYPTPSELAQCDSRCQREAGHRPACLCEPQGVGLLRVGVWGVQWQAWAGPQKLHLAFLSRGAVSTKAWSMRGDKRCLWSSGTDRLPGLTHSKRGDEWMCQAKHTANMSICMSVCCLSAYLESVWGQKQYKQNVCCYVKVVTQDFIFQEN